MEAVYITAGAVSRESIILVTYHFLCVHLRLKIAFSQTFLKVSPSSGVVSILPRVDLTENTEMD